MMENNIIKIIKYGPQFSEIQFWVQCHDDLHLQEPNLTSLCKTDHLASATKPDLEISITKQIKEKA